MSEEQITRTAVEIATGMLKQIKVLSECLTDMTEWANFSQADCPIRASGLDHYRTSQYLAESGIDWTCPFCGEADSI